MDLTTLKTEDELLSAYFAILNEDKDLAEVGEDEDNITRPQRIQAMHSLIKLEQSPNREIRTRRVLLQYFIKPMLFELNLSASTRQMLTKRAIAQAGEWLAEETFDDALSGETDVVHCTRMIVTQAFIETLGFEEIPPEIFASIGPLVEARLAAVNAGDEPPAGEGEAGTHAT